MTDPRWMRLCVDIDEAGHPIGSSYEVHQGHDVLSIHVGLQPGPFDTPAEVLTWLVDHSRRWERHTLFPH